MAIFDHILLIGKGQNCPEVNEACQGHSQFSLTKMAGRIINGILRAKLIVCFVLVIQSSTCVYKIRYMYVREREQMISDWDGKIKHTKKRCLSQSKLIHHVTVCQNRMKM